MIITYTVIYRLFTTLILYCINTSWPLSAYYWYARCSERTAQCQLEGDLGTSFRTRCLPHWRDRTHDQPRVLSEIRWLYRLNRKPSIYQASIYRVFYLPCIWFAVYSIYRVSIYRVSIYRVFDLPCIQFTMYSIYHGFDLPWIRLTVDSINRVFD